MGGAVGVGEYYASVIPVSLPKLLRRVIPMFEYLYMVAV